MAILSRGTDAVERRREAETAFLAATESLLAAGSSFTELSVERIAAAAGRSRTAFYVYFRDKRDLLMRLTESVSEQLYEQSDRWWSGEDGRGDLRAALTANLRTYAAHADLCRAVVETAGYDQEVGRFWRELVGRFVSATELRLVEEGLAEPADAAARAFALVWMVERTCYQQVVRGQPVDDPVLLDALVTIWERSAYGG